MKVYNQKTPSKILQFAIELIVIPIQYWSNPWQSTDVKAIGFVANGGGIVGYICYLLS